MTSCYPPLFMRTRNISGNALKQTNPFNFALPCSGNDESEKMAFGPARTLAYMQVTMLHRWSS
jgi:hypothetical protein